MGRLIEADALMETLERGDWVHVTDYNIAIYAVKGAPTVDAVEVVRCRECKYWKTAEGVKLSKRLKCCTYHIGHKYVRCDEDFCSRGEQKDEKGNGNEQMD